MQDLQAAAARGDHGVDRRAVEQGADAVAVAGEQARQDPDEIAGDVALGEAVGAEVGARAEVDEEPGAELAILRKLAHIGLLQPGGDVPVDVADVVVVLVLAQIGQVEPGAAPEGAVIALEHAIEPSDHGPFEALQQSLGAGVRRQRAGCSGFGTGSCRHALDHAWVASGLSGTGIAFSTRSMIASAFRPSASAS